MANNGDDVFAANVYDNSTPQTVSFSDGTRLAVWIGYNDALTGSDALNLYYSYFNGSWSVPQLVQNDGTADASPVLTLQGDTAYLVWQNAATSLNA